MENSKKKKSFMDSFSINDRDSCEKAIKNGGIAAMISAGITAAFAAMSFFTSSSNKDLSYFLDPFLFFDVVPIILMGIFVFRKSRVASTLLVIYFVLGKAIMWIDLGKVQGLFLSIIFLSYYVNAMRGTYIWRSTYRDGEIATPVA